MENRFSFKDLIPVVLLVVVIVVASLGLLSAKRQAGEIQEISTQVEKMQGEVEHLRTQLESLSGKLEALDEASATTPTAAPIQTEAQLPAPTTD